MLRRGSEETVPHADEPLMYLLQGVAGGGGDLPILLLHYLESLLWDIMTQT